MRGAAERAASTWRAPTATRDGDARRGAGEDASHRADRAKTPRRLEGRRSILRRGVGALAGTIAMLGAVARAQAPAATEPPATATPTTATPATEPDAPAAPIPPRPIASPPGAAATDGARGTAEGNTRLARDIETAPPPPSHVVYFQYGVAFATEQVLAPGPICDNTGVPCILGAGAGIVVRGGWRSTGPLYLGGAYELTKQDPNKLYRIALLQQARAEGRYYFMTARVTEPYASVGAGVAGYGNEWAIDTWGPTGAIGAGVEYQITRRTVVGLAFAYRLLYFSRFTDTAGSARNPGVAQLLGFDLVLEQRDAVVRAGADDARGR